MSNPKCAVCGKTAYAAEQVRPTDDVVLHKTCFRCAQCNTVLKLGNFAGLDGKYYCKPHFKQLFALKGNYNEGFGTEKHSANWLHKDGEHPEEKKVEEKKVEEKKKPEPKVEEKSEPDIVKPSSLLKNSSSTKQATLSSSSSQSTTKNTSQSTSSSATLSKSTSVGQSTNSNNTDIDKKTKEIEDKLDKLYQKIQERKKLIQQLTAEVEAMG
eukprot:Phypoly_transcript_18253.p1 GENE.Phypoly_transcript_18253~~Phypoly_transcript_18253.p1  ORF type:complete len:212 (+),score=48.17 Phypoly_transcript_18253:100-735(+)